MKNFIIIPPFRNLVLSLGLFIYLGTTVYAQQNVQVDISSETPGKVKVVKVIDGKTTVEEYDAADFDEKMIWVEENVESTGDGEVHKRVIIIDDGDGEKVIELKGNGGEHPRMIFIDEEEEIHHPDGKQDKIVIEKTVEGDESGSGTLRMHTIKVVNGDTVLNEVRGGEAGEFILEMKGEGNHPDGAHIMIMEMDGEEGEISDQDINVKVIKGKDGENSFEYEVIVKRVIKSVKVEEPAAGELEKFSGQGSNDLQVKKLNAYPNPNEGRFTLSFDLKDRSTPAQLRIFNLEGQEIYQEEFSGSKHYEKQIDLGHVPAGVYILRIIQGDESLTRKLVIE